MHNEIELYIHIPFCIKKCAYCDFLSFTADEKTQRMYAEALIREIKYYGAKLKNRRVSTIYIGGGTPSWLSEDLMLAVIDAIGQNFQISPDVEASMECNPGTVTKDKLLAYYKAGINRLSIGLQSASNDELKLLGRVHTYEQFLKTYELARTVGYANINVDIISGLPYQDVNKLGQTLNKLIQLKPEHISAYSLIIEKGTPFYETYKFDAVRQEAGLKPEVLPDEDETYRMIKTTQYKLKEAGYKQYEISNFAKEGYACRHNLGYWTRQDYLGLGLGAASLMDNVRYSNTRDLYTYMELTRKITAVGASSYAQKEKWNEACIKMAKEAYVTNQWHATCIHTQATPIPRQGQMEEFMFLGLRKTDGVSRSDFERCFGVPIEVTYRAVLEELKADGLLRAEAGRIFLTDRGMDLSNYAMSKFIF